MSNWVDVQAEERLKRNSKVLKELETILETQGQAPEKTFIDSRQAEICTAVTIMVYALFIGVELEIETNYPEAAQHMAIALLVCHVLFNIIFIVELVLRLRSVGLRYCSPFNPVGFFDTLIILIGTGETLFSVVLAMMSQDNAGSVMAIAGVMRILRLLRLARLLRGFLVCHELRLLVTGMILALPTVLWAGVLFGIVVYLGTMFSVILLGNVEELHDYFGTFGLALWSHFVIVTMETWPDIADAVLEVASPLWGLYFVVFICVSSMSLMNLVTGVIAEKLITTRDEPMPEGPRDEQEVFQKEKAALKADLSALLLDEVDIDVDLFGGLLETPTLRTWLHKLQVSSELPAHELYELISSGVKEHLSLDELVEGLFFLRGSSLRVHSLLLQQDLRRYSAEELESLKELQAEVREKTQEELGALQEAFVEELAKVRLCADHDHSADEGVQRSSWEAEIANLERLAQELESLKLSATGKAPAPTSEPSAPPEAAEVSPRRGPETG